MKAVLLGHSNNMLLGDVYWKTAQTTKRSLVGGAPHCGARQHGLEPGHAQKNPPRR